MAAQIHIIYYSSVKISTRRDEDRLAGKTLRNRKNLNSRLSEKRQTRETVMNIILSIVSKKGEQ